MTSPAWILVVDDEPDLELLIRQRFRRQIRAGELEFDFAMNGEEALEMLASHHRVYDMVLTDINMPVMDGLTLLSRIKEQDGPYKAVIVSAYGDLENIRTAMNRGAFDFVTKPIDFSDLELTIRKTLSEVRLIRQGMEAHEKLEYTLIEKERAELEKDRARQSEKFKQQFLANMSHEIRTPMNSVIGLTNLLRKTPLDNQQSKYVETIQKASENLLIIINDILDISKIEAGKLQLEQIAFSLHDSLNNLFQIMKVKADEKKLGFSLEIDDTIPPVLLGDTVRLNQILINLVGNAIKFTETGEVIMRASTLSLSDNNCTVRFEVVDTGIGIEDEAVKVIFESFSQASSDTNRRFGGTGLGLSIAKQLIQLHGGRISLESKLGEGTTFTFEIPYLIGSHTDLSLEETRLEANSEDVRGLKVLLVEDNAFNQMVAIDTLQELIPDVSIDVAENGAIGVEKSMSQAYDVILMDIQMPVMDGFEATRTIRKQTAGKTPARIMAMTANVTRDEVDKCFDCGVDEYIAKPFDPQELLAKIIKLVKRPKTN